MKRIDLGQTIQVLANVGVIAGIVFLGFQLRQNTAIVRGTTYQSMSDIAVNQIEGVAHDTQLGVALNRTFAGAAFDSFDEEQVAKLNFFYWAFVQRLENIYNQRQAGLVDDRVFDSYGWNSNIPGTLSFRQYWFAFGRGLSVSDEFSEYFEQHFELEPPPAGEELLRPGQ